MHTRTRTSMCPSQCHFFLRDFSGNKKRHRRRRLAYLIVSLFVSMPAVLKAVSDSSKAVSLFRRPGTTPSFLSFDMGGSGLKLLPLVIVPRNGSREVIAMGHEYKLGYIPLEEDPIDWVQRKVTEHFPSLKSISDWPHFAMSGSWDLFKLYGPAKGEAMLAMEKGGKLHSLCKEGYKEDPPACKKFRPPAEIFGFIQRSERKQLVHSPGYKGFFSDVKTQFESARATLEQLAGDKRTAHELGQSSKDNGRSTTPYSFVSWGFGTGQTLAWAAQRKHDAESWLPVGYMYSPWVNRTASERPLILDSSAVARALTLHRKNGSDGELHTYMIKVKIPKKTQVSLKNKNPDFLEKVGKEMHLYSIMHGNNWKVKRIRHDLREIYRSFFQDQVIGAINDGILPKPHAMVFSGGLENFARISDLVRDILSEQNITSIAAHPDGVHCGVVRLAWPNDVVVCNL